MGVDLGSTSAECVVVDLDTTVVGTATVETGTVSRQGMSRAINSVLEQLGIERDAVLMTAGTGYGRRVIPGGVDRVFTEITCHARGVAALFPDVRLVIDIGGQDSKAILVDQGGVVDRFAMNDRCASGTGRSYEVLARALEMDVADIGELAMSGNPDLEISSLCATFAATEVISLLARGEEPADIAASVHRATAARTLGLVGQVGKRCPVVFTGGVARNAAAVHYLAEALDTPLLVPEDPQVTGALGAALLAVDALRGGDASESASNQLLTTLTTDGAGTACIDCDSGRIGTTIGPISVPLHPAAWRRGAEGGSR